MLTNWFEQFKQNSQISLLDLHLAQFLVNKVDGNDEIISKRFAFLIISLSQEVRSGHVCLDITRLNQQVIDPQLWQELNTPTVEDWVNVLSVASNKQVVSDGEQLAPLIFIENKLYFQRMWLDERHVAQYFNQPQLNIASSKPIDLKNILDQLFVDDNTTVDWQKIAVAVALTRKIAIISGGPGTGKTTTVAKILAGIVLNDPTTRIVAAAPTGKAASRLTESLSRAIEQLSFESLNIQTEAVTLHRLLGAKTDIAHLIIINTTNYILMFL